MPRGIGRFYSPTSTAEPLIASVIHRVLQERFVGKTATKGETMTTSRSRRAAVWLAVLAATTVSTGAGCTSVIGSAYLREAWLDAVEHAADEGPEPDAGTSAETTGPGDSATTADGVDSVSDDTPAENAAGDVWSPATPAEAIAEADRRLAAAGGLGTDARDTLIATLRATPRQDWAIVVDEFAAALVAAREATAAEALPPAPSSPAPTATATATPAAESLLPAVPPAPAPATAAAVVPAVTEAAPPAAPEPTAEPPALAIHNACFASRVRAWSVVDRFEAAEFRPGQDVIVYFELDQLASRDDDQGHTTRVETVLRLVDTDGRRLHEWSFEPLEETCGGRRRDYFARYLIAIPPTTPAGQCRLEIAATDAIGGRTAHATLPLEVVAR